MTQKEISDQSIQRRKRTIGIVAIILLLTITVVSIFMHINYLFWVLADLVVAGVANLLLRRVGRRPL